MMGVVRKMLGTPYGRAKRRVERLPPTDQLRLVGEILAELGERAGDDVYEKTRVALVDLHTRGTALWRKFTLADQVGRPKPNDLDD